MKKIQKSLLTVVFFLTFLPSYSQIMAITYYDDSWQLTPKNFGKYFRIGVLDTVKYQYFGEIKDHYVSGKLQMKGKFQANVKVDTFYFYYSSGQLKTQGAYQNNVRYGIWTNYYENGKIKDKIASHNNFLGVLEYYDENGNPKITKGTGIWETEYIHDQVKEQITLKGGFKDTLRHGTWTYYKKAW